MSMAYCSRDNYSLECARINSFSFVVALGYLYYQRQQDRNLGTFSYLDIYEWLVVVCINVAAFVPLKVMGLI